MQPNQHKLQPRPDDVLTPFEDRPSVAAGTASQEAEAAGRRWRDWQKRGAEEDRERGRTMTAVIAVLALTVGGWLGAQVLWL